MAKTKNRRLTTNRFSRTYLSLFLLAFALVGGFAIYRIFAATPNTGILEAESMKHYKNVKSYSDMYVSGHHYASVNSDAPASKRKLTGKVSTGTVPGWRFVVVARAKQCHGHWPTFKASLSGDTNTSMKFTVKSRGWRTYAKEGLSAPASKSYNVTITYSVKMRYGHGKYCNTGLAFDVVLLKPQPVEITNVSSTVKKKKATINATLNNHNSEVSYYVEYGTSTSYGNVTASTKMKPSSDPKSIKVQLSKFLEKNTTYHYRVCANNGGEVDCSGDYTFTTDGKGDKKGGGKGGDGNGCKKHCGGNGGSGSGGNGDTNSGQSSSGGSETAQAPPPEKTLDHWNYQCVYGNPHEQRQPVYNDGSVGSWSNMIDGSHC